MARFGLSLLEAKRLTLSDFYNYNLAYDIAQNDLNRDFATQAWMNREMKAIKGKGKNARFVYEKPEDLYKHKNIFKKIINGEEETNTVTLADKNKWLKNLGRGGN